MNKPKKSRRVLGSCLVTYDEKGALMATDFRAYKKRPKELATACLLHKNVSERTDVYEYTEHFKVTVKIPKNRVQRIFDRDHISEFAAALSAIGQLCPS